MLSTWDGHSASFSFEVPRPSSIANNHWWSVNSTLPRKMLKMKTVNKKMTTWFFYLGGFKPGPWNNECCIKIVKSLPRFKPPTSYSLWFVPLHLDLAKFHVPTCSSLCLLLGSFSQCFIALSLKGFDVILAHGTSKHHGSTSKWWGIHLRWMGKFRS